MAENTEARLNYLGHTKDEWEDFLDSPKWREITRRGQEMADVLQHRMMSMPVTDMNGVIELLSVRAQLVGVMKQSLVPLEIMRELNDEITKLSGDDDGAS